GKRLANRPGAYGLDRLQTHRVEERPHPFAFERRHQYPPLPHMRRAVQHEDRGSPDGCGQDLIGLARVQDVRVAAEDLSNRLRLRQHDKSAVSCDVECEGITKDAVGFVENAKGVARETQELPPRRGVRAWRKGRCGWWRDERLRHDGNSKGKDSRSSYT